MRSHCKLPNSVLLYASGTSNSEHPKIRATCLQRTHLEVQIFSFLHILYVVPITSQKGTTSLQKTKHCPKSVPHSEVSLSTTATVCTENNRSIII